MTPDALAALCARAYTHMAPWSAPALAGMLDQTGTILTLSGPAFVLGRVVLDEAEVLALATDPHHQRQGHAARAFDDFAAQAADRTAERLFLEVAADNAPALRFYTRMGLATAGRRRAYYRRDAAPAADALIMTAPLPLPVAKSG